MGIALVVLHVIICFILIGVILLQAGRGQGFTGSGFGGGGVQSLLGTRAADFLTKATSVAAVLFLFTCIGLDIIEAGRSRSLFETKQPQAPVALDQIQKVLEKIKAEDQAKTQATTASAGTEAGKEEAPAPVTASQAPPPVGQQTAPQEGGAKENGGT